MPWTIYCPKTDRLPAMCHGIFDTETLAKRHAQTRIKDRTYNFVKIQEPLLPENYMSFERMLNATNFALTVLRDVDKARKEGYIKKCVEELESSINEKPYEVVLYKYSIQQAGDSYVHTSVAVDEQTALRQLGFPDDLVERWQQYFVITNKGPAS